MIPKTTKPGELLIRSWERLVDAGQIGDHKPVRSPYTLYQFTPWNFRIRIIGAILCGMWLCKLLEGLWRMVTS